MIRKSMQVVVLTVVAASTAFAQESYTRFLLPFYTFDRAGAHGSVWEVRTWIHNGGTEPVNVVPPPVCGFAVPCSGGLVLAPNLAPLPVRPFENVATGFFLRAESEHAADVVFSSRVRDLSVEADSAGTELPVVREDRFSSGPLALINVPLEAPRFRAMLRVYALPEVLAPREVELRCYRLPSFIDVPVEEKILLHTQRLLLGTPAGAAQSPEHYAAYAEVASIASIPQLAFEDAVWIEVEPVTPGLRIWGFVSVTNNETQQVTLVTPSPQ